MAPAQTPDEAPKDAIARIRKVIATPLSDEQKIQAEADDTLSHIERAKLGKYRWNTWAIWVFNHTYKYMVPISDGEDDPFGNGMRFINWMDNECDPPIIDFSKELKDKGKTEIPFSDFTGYFFPANVNFKTVTFSQEADFIGATFSDTAEFIGATFSKMADFNGAEFSGWAVFNGATFSGWADFNEAEFSGWAVFRVATFSTGAIFMGAKFSGWAVFQEATFSQEADFYGAEFSGWADFRETKFSKMADFIGATFSDKADFNEAEFSGWANFRQATFSKMADFRRAEFSGWANFRQATFSDTANFRQATFSDTANFNGATFSKQGEFLFTLFASVAYFRDCKFLSTVNFDHARFGDKKLSKSGAHVIPDFRNASFKQTPNLGYVTINPPKKAIKSSDQSSLFRRTGISRFESKYIEYPDEYIEYPDEYIEYPDEYAPAKLRKLREMATLGQNHMMEQYFFRWELLEKRGKESRGAESAFITAYEWFSGCGQSLMRPVTAWVMTLALFMVVYFYNSDWTLLDMWEAGSLGALLQFSFLNSLPILGLGKSIASSAAATLFGGESHVPFFWTVAHNLLSSIFTFLFFLAVRNRFKIR